MSRSLGIRIASIVALLLLGAAAVFAGGSGEPASSGSVDEASGGGNASSSPDEISGPGHIASVDEIPDGMETAVFAGGCFWCMEEAYELVPGVMEAISGYAGGDVPDPSYRQVVAGGTGHYEVVIVVYDPEVVTYEELLYVFWRNVDLFDAGGQFCDRGESYRTAIFYETERQRELAEASKQELVNSGRFSREIVTPILPLDVIENDGNDGFWIAEEYHQDYYLKNPIQYRFYKEGCGRARRLEQIWGDEAGAPSLQEET